MFAQRHNHLPQTLQSTKPKCGRERAAGQGIKHTTELFAMGVECVVGRFLFY
jgi:hypothetical protein